MIEWLSLCYQKDMMSRIFRDRKHAGQMLAERLKSLSKSELANAMIVALPRGGVAVGFEIAKSLDLPLEILIVRKIGHPLQPEYGVGAAVEGGFYWIDPEADIDLPNSRLEATIEKEKAELERRIKIYSKDKSQRSFTQKIIILFDDGIATGVTARVAARFAKEKKAQKVILAVPVCSRQTAQLLRNEVDEVICLSEVPLFFAVGDFFENFDQVTDQEVLSLLSSR